MPVTSLRLLAHAEHAASEYDMQIFIESLRVFNSSLDQIIQTGIIESKISPLDQGQQLLCHLFES